MLSTAVLDADAFPAISIDSVAVTKRAAAGGFEATVTVGVAGHESRLVVPIAVQSDATHLSATGSLELRQSTLGLTPYSLMLGALQVQDAITVKFKIVARPA
jgi:polyisoprenoid-binding protein YceI